MYCSRWNSLFQHRNHGTPTMKPLDVLLILVSVLFATGLIVDKKWEGPRKQHELSVAFQRDHLERVADLLRDHHERTGRYPTMEEGLESVPGLREATFTGDFKRLAATLESLPGVRSPQGVPYLYENRKGALNAEKGAFRDSPARIDRKVERYSERVDDGVFIVSLGLMHDVRRVFGEAWMDALLWLGGGLLFTLSLAYILMRNRNRTADRYRGINATIIVGVTIVLSLVFLLTGGQSRGRRHVKFDSVGSRADLAQEYLSILGEWTNAGAFDRAAYEKVAAQMRTEFGLRVDPLPPPKNVTAPNDPVDSTDRGG